MASYQEECSGSPSDDVVVAQKAMHNLMLYVSKKANGDDDDTLAKLMEKFESFNGLPCKKPTAVYAAAAAGCNNMLLQPQHASPSLVVRQSTDSAFSLYISRKRKASSDHEGDDVASEEEAERQVLVSVAASLEKSLSSNKNDHRRNNLAKARTMTSLKNGPTKILRWAVIIAYGPSILAAYREMLEKEQQQPLIIHFNNDKPSEFLRMYYKLTESCDAPKEQDDGKNKCREHRIYTTLLACKVAMQKKYTQSNGEQLDFENDFLQVASKQVASKFASRVPEEEYNAYKTFNCNLSRIGIVNHCNKTRGPLSLEKLEMNLFTFFYATTTTTTTKEREMAAFNGEFTLRDWLKDFCESESEYRDVAKDFSSNFFG